MSDIGNPKYYIPNPTPQPEFTRALPTTHNPQPTTHTPQPTTHNPQPTTHNPNPMHADSDDSNAEGFYANSYPDEDDDDGDDLSHEGGG